MKKHLNGKFPAEGKIKKIKLFGIDANPLAVQTTFTNSILFLLNHTGGDLNDINTVEFHFFQDDALLVRFDKKNDDREPTGKEYGFWLALYGCDFEKRNERRRGDGANAASPRRSAHVWPVWRYHAAIL